jgi:hypothetical protein
MTTDWKTARSVRAVLFVSLALVEVAIAGDVQWVQPGVYTFGSCGGLGGDSVPGTVKRYYHQDECNREYQARQCYVQATWYERQFAENHVTKCGSWLQTELRQCENDVQERSSQCSRVNE